MEVLKTRKLIDSDYDEILVKWWKDWKWEPPAKDFLPDSGRGGIIVFDGDEPICAGFMYITNSKVAWVDWIISSREYTKREERRAALKLLIESLTDFCKNTGSKYVYALIKNQSLIKVYKDAGYINGDTYTSEMIKIL